MLNQRGYSLIELIVASGLIVFAMLAFATMISSQHFATVQTQQTVEATAATRRIQQFVSSPESCLANLNSRNPNTAVNLTTLVDATPLAPATVFWTDENVTLPRQEFGGLIYLDNLELKPGPVAIGPNSSGIMLLTITLTSVSDSKEFIQLQPRTFPIYVETDSAGGVNNCSSKTSSAYSCRDVRVSVNGVSAIASCNQPFEQMISCGVEDRNISVDNPNILDPIPAGVTVTAATLPVYIPPTDDAFVNALTPTINYGGAGTLYAG